MKPPHIRRGFTQERGRHRGERYGARARWKAKENGIIIFAQSGEEQLCTPFKELACVECVFWGRFMKYGCCLFHLLTPSFLPTHHPN